MARFLVTGSYGSTSTPPQYTVQYDGDYLLVIHMQGPPKGSFNGVVDVEMIGKGIFFHWWDE